MLKKALERKYPTNAPMLIRKRKRERERGQYAFFRVNIREANEGMNILTRRQL